MRYATHGGQSSDSLGEGGSKAGDYTIAPQTILVQKLAISNGNIRDVSSSEMQTSSKQYKVDSNKLSVFASMDEEKLMFDGASPKRKSVLSRASKASPKVSP